MGFSGVLLLSKRRGEGIDMCVPENGLSCSIWALGLA